MVMPDPAKKNFSSEEDSKKETPTLPPGFVPAPPAVQTNAQGSRPSINLSNLGTYLDGWADIAEGMGDKDIEVRREVIKELRRRNMPSIQHEIKTGYITGELYEKRDFIISETSPGIKTTISIQKHGADLYVAWRTWIAPVVNLALVIGMLVMAFILGMATGGVRHATDFWGYSERYFSFEYWMYFSIGFLILETIILATVGRFLKGDAQAFFLIQTNLFDADDVTALSLAVHKTVLRALDSSGIDVTKLRIKKGFSGGRKGEDV